MRTNTAVMRLMLTAGLALALTGCLGGPRAAAVPILLVPEAPPRVVAEFPPEPEPIPDAELDRTPDVAGQPSAFVPLPPPIPPRPVAPVPTGEPEPVDETAAEDVRLRRQLISVPDQEFDRQSVRQTLDEAQRMLGEVVRMSLDSAGRAQYDTAERFLEQARAALATDNFIFAHYLGQKARTLAAGL